MPFTREATTRSRSAVADAAPLSLWLDSPQRPDPVDPLTVALTADLLVVGAGYTGLWTALLARERRPEWDIVVLEGATAGWAASGRNGGFVAASLTHGIANGVARWPDEARVLQALGQSNLEAIEATVLGRGIDCDWWRTGELDVATAPHQVDGLHEHVALTNRYAAPATTPMRFLDTDEVRAEIHSPSYLAGAFDADGVALVDPARLAWGLRGACLAEGVRIFEKSPVTSLRSDGDAVLARTEHGRVRAHRVALATNAFPPLLRRLRHWIVPVYDYVLGTEPLTPLQWESLGWAARQGVGDSANLFHYTRPTADGRILWGGYLPVYGFGGGVGPHREQDPDLHALLAEHFLATFPQLDGIRFSHAWSGAIDTCSRFAPFWGTAHGGRTVYVAGYTGLGVGATRFGAQVMLDLLEDEGSARTELAFVRSKPIPFPPEPLRWIGITASVRSMEAADADEGRRNLWLRSLDRVGLGFDF